MVKSPIKIIDSGAAPTVENLGEGQIAFGTVGNTVKLYGSDGTTVSELGGGGGGSEVNSIAPLKVNTAPTTDADTVSNVAVGEQATATLGDLSGLSEEKRAQLEAMIEQAGGAGNTSIGVRAAATGLMCMAIGGGAQAGENLHEMNTSDGMGGGYGSIALGPDTRAPEVGAVSVGMSAHAKSPCAIAIGFGSNAEVHPTHANIENGSVAIGASASAPEPYSVAIGAKSVATDSYVFSVGGMGLTRRITNVTDPTFDEDAANKKYVDTQLDPINTKLQYVPENTNQILSQIQTNVEKAQSAADAKVASITAGTGISVDASNPTTPIVSTTGLATQASVDALTNTVNSKADQTAVDAKVSSVTAGTGVSVTGPATAPVISGMIAVPDWANGVDINTDGLVNGLWTAPSSGVIVPNVCYIASGPPTSGVKSGRATIYNAEATSIKSEVLVSFGFMFGGQETAEGCQMPIPIEAGYKYASGLYSDIGIKQDVYTTGGIFFPYKFVEIS